MALSTSLFDGRGRATPLLLAVIQPDSEGRYRSSASGLTARGSVESGGDLTLDGSPAVPVTIVDVTENTIRIGDRPNRFDLRAYPDMDDLQAAMIVETSTGARVVDYDFRYDPASSTANSVRFVTDRTAQSNPGVLYESFRTLTFSGGNFLRANGWQSPNARDGGLAAVGPPAPPNRQPSTYRHDATSILMFLELQRGSLLTSVDWQILSGPLGGSAPTFTSLTPIVNRPTPYERFTGLDSTQDYYVRARTRNANGVSGWSDPARVRLLPQYVTGESVFRRSTTTPSTPTGGETDEDFTPAGWSRAWVGGTVPTPASLAAEGARYVLALFLPLKGRADLGELRFRQPTFGRARLGRLRAEGDNLVGRARLGRLAVEIDALQGIRTIWFSRRDATGIDRSGILDSDSLDSVPQLIGLRFDDEDGKHIAAFQTTAPVEYCAVRDAFRFVVVRSRVHDVGFPRRVDVDSATEQPVYLLLPDLRRNPNLDDPDGALARSLRSDRNPGLFWLEVDTGLAGQLRDLDDDADWPPRAYIEAEKATPGRNQIGDTVILFRGQITSARSWEPDVTLSRGGRWIKVETFLAGDLLATGTIIARHLAAKSVTAEKIRLGAGLVAGTDGSLTLQIGDRSISLDGDGIKLRVGRSLSTTTGELEVKPDPNKGLTVGDDGVGVNTGAGLDIGADGVTIVTGKGGLGFIGTDKTLSILRKDGNSGLEVVDGKLGVIVQDGSGMSLTNEGLAIQIGNNDKDGGLTLLEGALGLNLRDEQPGAVIRTYALDTSAGDDPADDGQYKRISDTVAHIRETDADNVALLSPSANIKKYLWLGTGDTATSHEVTVAEREIGGVRVANTYVVTFKGAVLPASGALTVSQDDAAGIARDRAGRAYVKTGSSGLTLTRDGLGLQIGDQSGLAFTERGLGIVVGGENASLELLGNRLGLRPDSNNQSIEVVQGGVRVKPGAGLSLTPDGLAVVVGDNSGLVLTDRKLAIVVGAGIQVGSGGVAIKPGDRTLRTDGDGVKVNPGNSLTLTSDGLDVDLSGTNAGLERRTDGLAIKVAPNAGLTFDSQGRLEVQSQSINLQAGNAALRIAGNTISFVPDAVKGAGLLVTDGKLGLGADFQSSNYSPGDNGDGWRIQFDGKAFFDAAGIRGKLQAKQIRGDVFSVRKLWESPSASGVRVPRTNAYNNALEVQLAEKPRSFDIIRTFWSERSGGGQALEEGVTLPRHVRDGRPGDTLDGEYMRWMTADGNLRVAAARDNTYLYAVYGVRDPFSDGGGATGTPTTPDPDPDPDPDPTPVTPVVRERPDTPPRPVATSATTSQITAQTSIPGGGATSTYTWEISKSHTFARGQTQQVQTTEPSASLGSTLSLTANTQVWIRVKAGNGLGESGWSAVLATRTATASSGAPSTAPGKPGTPTASVVDSHSFTVRWTAPTSGGSGLYEYEVFFGTVRGDTSRWVGRKTVEGTSANFGTRHGTAAVVPGRTYYVWVRAVDTEGSGVTARGPFSEQLQLTTRTSSLPNAQLQPPTNVQISRAPSRLDSSGRGDQYSISWTAVAGATNYEFQLAHAGSSDLEFNFYAPSDTMNRASRVVRYPARISSSDPKRYLYLRVRTVWRVGTRTNRSAWSTVASVLRW